MQDLNDKITGSTLTASEWNEVPSELQNVIENTGQTLSGGDLNQLGKGIADYSVNGTFYTDSGAADAYVLTTIGLKQTSTAYTDGFAINFVPGNTNTGASTVNVGSLGVKSLKYFDGSDMPAGVIATGSEVGAVYDGTDFIYTPRVTEQTFAEMRGGRVNYIRNGGMSAVQRGTSFPTPLNNDYTIDGYVALVDTVNDLTSVDRTGSQNEVASFVSIAGAGSGLGMRVELVGGDFTMGRTFTFSAEINPSDTDVDIGITYRLGNSFISNIVATTSITSQLTASVYSKVSVTFTLPVDANLGTMDNIQIAITSTAANSVNMRKPQMEEGSIATEFEYISPAAELAWCQRYYQVIGRVSVFTSDTGGNIILNTFGLSATMRATPTVTEDSNTDDINTNTFVYNPTASNLGIQATATSGTGVYRTTRVNVRLDAEL